MFYTKKWIYKYKIYLYLFKFINISNILIYSNLFAFLVSYEKGIELVKLSFLVHLSLKGYLNYNDIFIIDDINRSTINYVNW